MPERSSDSPHHLRQHTGVESARALPAAGRGASLDCRRREVTHPAHQLARSEDTIPPQGRADRGCRRGRRQVRFLLPVDGSPRLLAAVRRDSTPRKEISAWLRPGTARRCRRPDTNPRLRLATRRQVIVAYAERKGGAEIIMGTCGPRSRRRGCCSARLCEAR
jgi:hypothetical protein